MNIRHRSTEKQRQAEQMAHNVVRLADYHARRFAYQQRKWGVDTVTLLPTNLRAIK